MTTFALIHGGAHGSWCWELVVPMLEARGHRVVTSDLPFEDGAGAREWAATVIADLEAAGADPADVVLVGHSMSGMALPVIASKLPVRRMVFLGAMVPVPGRVYAEYLAEEPGAVTFRNEPADGEVGAAGLTWEAARAGFYQDCDEAVARRAWERLRPSNVSVFTERCPIDTWPDVPSTSIVMTEDAAVGPDWSRRVARERLGAELIELPGGHSPFYSRPAELVDVLVGL